MLFHVTHVHTKETCPAVVPNVRAEVLIWWKALQARDGMKVVGALVSPTDHTFYLTLEADDFLPVAQALGRLNAIGSATVTPVIAMGDAFSMMEAGTFGAEA